MSYSSLFIGPFVFVHWTRAEHADLVTLDTKVRRHHEQVRMPLISVSIHDNRSEAPEPDVRDALVAQTGRIAEVVRSFYVVSGGTGFRGTVQRSVLAGMFLVYRGPVRPTVVATVDAVLDRERDHGLSRARILEELRAGQLVLD